MVPHTRAMRLTSLAGADPKIIRAGLRVLQGLQHGLQIMVDGGLTEVGATPKQLVFEDGKLRVWRYDRPQAIDFELGPSTMTVEPAAFPVPVLLVPPLMVRPFVYDLREEHSMVRVLRRAGFDVFLVDFGVPDASDREVRLDHYVLDYLPKAIEAMRRASGQREVSLCGYCMGGIFALLHAATFRDPDVKNVVTIGAPIDFSKLGLLTLLARATSGQVDRLMDRMGNVPGDLSSQAFKLLAPLRRFTRTAELLVNLWDEEYVRGHESIARWTSEFIPYPRDAFKQLMSAFFRDNGLVSTMRFGERVADLRAIRCSVLAFAGASDQVAPPASARVIRDLCASPDLEYVEVPGGHIGVFAGPRAPALVWQKTADWLRPRSVSAPP